MQQKQCRVPEKTHLPRFHVPFLAKPHSCYLFYLWTRGNR